MALSPDFLQEQTLQIFLITLWIQLDEKQQVRCTNFDILDKLENHWTDQSGLVREFKPQRNKLGKISLGMFLGNFREV